MENKKVLVILAHPDAKNSFNGAIAQRTIDALATQGYEPVFRDLYAEGFDPIMTLAETKESSSAAPLAMQKEMQAVKECAGMVFIHPNWWGAPPAILLGWIDRVLRNGFAYGFTESGPWQGLSDKLVQVFTTSNTPREYEISAYGDPLEKFWGTLVFGVVGSSSFERRNFEQIIMSDDAQRKGWLNDVESIIRRRFI